MSPRVLDFPPARVRVFDDRVESCFHVDGSLSTFYPPVGKPEFEDAARFAGYVDSRQFGTEHDILHHYVAERLGWERSYVVWWDAHGQEDDGAKDWRDLEEHIVVRLQRYIQTGKLDSDFGVLIGQFGVGLPEVARNGLLLVRPWLT